MSRCAPLLDRIKQVGTLIESTCGQGGTFTSAEFGTRISSAQIEVDPSPQEDETLTADLSPSPVVMGEKLATARIAAYLVGSGVAATKPEIDALLRMCGMVSEVVKYIPIGAVAGGPFVPGETVTQATSLATGMCVKGTQNGDTHLFIVERTGTWNNTGVITGSISAATATPTATPTADGFVYHPVASASMETGAIKLEEDGTVKVLVGGMGNFTISAESSMKAKIEFTINGAADLDLFGDAALTAGVTYPDTVYPVLTDARCTLDRGVAAEFTPILRSISLDMQNEATMRKDGNAESGLIASKVTRRVPQNIISVESMLAADYDIYSRMKNATSTTLGYRFTAPDNEVWVFGVNAQIVNPGDGSADGFKTNDITYRMNRTNGNDEIWIAFTVH